MTIFTSICANYVHKARVLARSVKKNIPNVRMVVCLVEREIIPGIPDSCFDEIILAKDAWEGNFDRFIFKHSIVEASTAVKGQFFRYLMDRYPEENQFVYLDPDVRVYSDLTELREELCRHPIVLCPHLLRPGNIDMELSSTAHGVFNLGFLGISRNEEGRRCVDWWAERLYLFCYDDIQRGIFTDQKWFDLVPCFFDAKILKHNGYDFAPWSLKNCHITQEGEAYFIEGDPLRFIHYSGFGASAEMCMEKWLPPEGELFREIYANYAREHAQSDEDGISKTPWSYRAYHSGEVISDQIRKAYRDNYEVMFLHEDPFAHSNQEYRELLNLRVDGKVMSETTWQRRWRKAKRILREQGLQDLCRFVLQWLKK